MTKDNLTLKKVCQELDKSKRTTTRYIKKGLLNTERVKSEKGIPELSNLLKSTKSKATT
jgi:predicted site-specific integrase-resolvase